MSSERIHSTDWLPAPSVFRAENATSRPSGDTERPPVVAHPAGGVIAKRRVCRVGAASGPVIATGVAGGDAGARVSTAAGVFSIKACRT